MTTQLATKADMVKASEQNKAPDKQMTEAIILSAMNNRISTPEGLAFHLVCHDSPAVVNRPNRVTNVTDGGAWVMITFLNEYSLNEYSMRTETIKDRLNLINWTQHYSEHRFSKERSYAELFGPSDVSFVKTPGQNFNDFIVKVPEAGSNVPRHRYTAALVAR